MKGQNNDKQKKFRQSDLKNLFGTNPSLLIYFTFVSDD